MCVGGGGAVLAVFSVSFARAATRADAGYRLVVCHVMKWFVRWPWTWRRLMFHHCCLHTCTTTCSVKTIARGRVTVGTALIMSVTVTSLWLNWLRTPSHQLSPASSSSSSTTTTTTTTTFALEGVVLVLVGGGGNPPPTHTHTHTHIRLSHITPTCSSATFRLDTRAGSTVCPLRLGLCQGEEQVGTPETSLPSRTVGNTAISGTMTPQSDGQLTNTSLTDGPTD